MQSMTRTSASQSGASRLALAASLIWVPLALGAPAHAQTSELATATSAPAPVIPQQVRYAGKLATRAGDTVEAVFSIYASEEGGEPLWTETQKVTVDSDGSYTVLLGSATQNGLPQTLFAVGAARWLGVAVERAQEQPRVLLSSVPYAMKSADAQALAGHPAGDFVTQEQLSQFSQSEAQRTASNEFQPLVSGTITGSGTAGTIAQFTGANTVGNSKITQVGSEIGINEASPVATLDVNGPGQFRGTLTIPAKGVATTTTSQPSQDLEFAASGWSTTAAGPVTPTFFLYNGVLGNNTANPEGEIQLGYQLGSTHTDVLSITGTGPLFAYGGLTAATTTLATTSAASNSPAVQMNAYVYSSKTSGQVSENFAWQVIPTGNDTTSPSANLNLLYGTGTTNPTGFSISSKGIINWATGQTFPITGTGGGTITGITTSSPLTGSGTSGTVALGLNTSALETTLNGVYAQLGAANTFTQPITFASGQTFPGTGTITEVDAGSGLYGGGTSGAVGLGVDGSQIPYLAYSNTFGDTQVVSTSSDDGFDAYTTGGYGVYGNSTNNYGVVGVTTNGNGVYGQVTAANQGGVIGRTEDSSGNWGVYAFGNIGATGTKSSVVQVENGTRQVALYAVESPGVWFEDYGSSQLASGVASITIDPGYAQTVNTGMEYLVFLTPEGECDGLYVTSKTATGFEVKELHHGKSNVTFDYRIVARRRGYETTRLEDVTMATPQAPVQTSAPVHLIARTAPGVRKATAK